MAMTVKEFSDITGIPASKIRYYDRSELIEGNRDQMNNYRCFTRNDALAVYHAQMLRSFDLCIPDVLAARNDGLPQLNRRVRCKIDELEKSIREQEIRLVRLKEMKRYFDLIDTYRNRVSCHELSESYNVWTVNCSSSADEQQAVRMLAEVMPFSYVCIRISSESVHAARSDDEPLGIALGLGILESNREKLGLQFPPSITSYARHPVIRILLETPDPFSICRRDIAPLLAELRSRGQKLTENIIGRIFISYKKNGAIVHGIGMGCGVSVDQS